MIKLSEMCQSPRTSIDKTSPYTQYYIGEKDSEARRSGNGANHWSGAESLEWYTGQFLRDTMHGPGDYRWRYRGPDGVFVTYEGNFYANSIHGYGAMSYPDGRVFTGLFHKNIRWGPGIESHACVKEDVGLWNGTKLVRLAWQPEAPSITFDMTSASNGRTVIDPHRVLLAPSLKIIGETNSALELLKQYGAQPLLAMDKWIKLYPKHCTDLESQLCQINAFDQSYYKRNVAVLEECNFPEKENVSDETQRMSKNEENMNLYYAWNNDKMVIHMMKHCYKHEYQRDSFKIELTRIISGPRQHLKPPGKHELDCRTLLMASYLGHIINVAQLINDCDVHPNVADCQGNTALMYATSGDQADVIHFLVEAGANVNSFNDSCCTALGLALMKYLCTEKNIPPNCMVQALLPQPTVPTSIPCKEYTNIFDWNMCRDQPVANQTNGVAKTPAKTSKGVSTKNTKPSLSIKDVPSPKKKIEGQSVDINDNESLKSFSEEHKLYYTINNEYLTKVNVIFQIAQPCVFPISYFLFEVNDMLKEIDVPEVDQSKKLSEKNPKKIVSKILKETMKPSKDLTWQSNDKEENISIDTTDKIKMESLSHIMLTILRLLSDGADPRLVRCPQPALFIATMSGCSELVRLLAQYGVDVNDTYVQTFNYTALDIAISLPFTFENVEVIQALLECGADAGHRLSYSNTEADATYSEIPGPTLLHAVLARKVENETEEHLRREILHLLLVYKCNATLQFKGRSAIDIAVAKNIDIFDIFIKCPNTNLNAIINSSNQTILVKIFTEQPTSTMPLADRLQMLADLMLFGADPLQKCQNEDETYDNLFVFARKTYKAIDSSQNKSSVTVGKPDPKGKKANISKKEDKLLMKSIGKTGAADAGDYKQAVDLVTDCARMLHIRWLQAKLIKELIEIINKFKHRHWNMILKEYKKKQCIGLWVTANRCLEIWDLLKTIKNKLYHESILNHLLYIVHFCNTKMKSKPKGPRYMTAQDKDLIEFEVNTILKEYKIATALTSEMVPLKRPYVTPELEVKADEKFNVCFECALPFEEEKIVCISCKLVSFCSNECLRANLDRLNCHPCSDFLRDIYYPNSCEVSDLLKRM